MLDKLKEVYSKVKAFTKKLLTHSYDVRVYEDGVFKWQPIGWKKEDSGVFEFNLIQCVTLLVLIYVIW